LHQEIPQAFGLDGDRALLREGHRVGRADPRAAFHTWVSAQPTMTAAISRLYAADPRWSLSGSTAALTASPAACKSAASSAWPARSAAAARARIGITPTEPSAMRAARQRSPSDSRLTVAATATVA